MQCFCPEKSKTNRNMQPHSLILWLPFAVQRKCIIPLDGDEDDGNEDELIMRNKCQSVRTLMTQNRRHITLKLCNAPHPGPRISHF